MKKIAMALFALIITIGSVSAQKVIVRPVAPAVAPHIIYNYPSPFWNPYFYGGLGWRYRWMYNYPPNYYRNHQTKLEQQIQGIEDDYSDRISSVRADNSLSGHERRQKIRALRTERDKAIYDLKSNYYKQYEN
ncbi:MAG: hypothetical protein JST21_12920 [Bacteroidetes bacterium]|nr:hypothetical protein [Bacteroidota bacterium]